LRDANERFGIASASDRERAGKLGRRRKRTAEKRENVMAKAIRVVFVNRTFDRIRFHQTDGAEWKRDTVLEHAALKEIQFEAAAPEVKN
jgi:hypothetical protein